MALVTAGGIVGVTVGLVLTATAMVVVPGLAEPSTFVTTALPLARLVLDLAALLAVGATLTPVLAGSGRAEASTELAIGRGVAAMSSAAWALAAVATLVLQVADANVGRHLTLGAVVEYATSVRSGLALLVVVICALIGLAVNAVSVRRPLAVRPGLPIVIAIATLLPLPPSGHIGDEAGVLGALSTVTIELHVLAATSWAGGLIAVIAVLGTRRSLLAEALPRFSRLATACVFTTAVTGVLAGVIILISEPGLHWYSAPFTTGYGHILLGKGIGVVAIGLLGAHIRFRLLPTVQAASRAAVLRWAGWELTVMGAAFGLAAVLVGSPIA
ncbi:CopD family protein [Kutzneria sp. NPDC051319]|uniref:copper resistance D family protein n=1 Tax=Kutzneria sp. NPDC051319 TaxID=3155047 RepID=UPI00344809D7